MTKTVLSFGLLMFATVILLGFIVSIVSAVTVKCQPNVYHLRDKVK